MVVRCTNKALILGMMLVLGGCASTIADLPAPIGLPAGTPERAANPVNYPNVYEKPQVRDSKQLTEDERKKLAAELDAARTANEAKGGIKPAAKKPKPKTPLEGR